MSKFFEHQSRIISQDPHKTGLWLGTGGGKTRTALALARGRTLVICPKTQKEDRNWERECDKMREAGITLKITNDIHPTNRSNNLKQGHAYPVVISKEEFRRDYAGLHAEHGFFNTVIVDEAETCLGVTPNERQRSKPKNALEQLIMDIHGSKRVPKASQLFEALQYYVETYQPDRLYLCTATITRTPMTVWAAGTILGKKWNWHKWRDTFYIKLPIPRREVWVPKKDEETKLRLAKAVNKIGFVGRLEDWFDVPEQTFRDDYVDMTDEQAARIRQLKLEVPDAIVQIGKRHQIENGTLKGDQFNDDEVFPTRKLERIMHYAEEFPRMIIWAKFTKQIELIHEKLTKEGYTVYTLTGATKDREDVFRAIQNAPQAILIAQAQISAGWEWKECGVSIFASRTYSVADYEQALGRVQRTDAIKKNLYINLITRGGIDEAVHETLVNKKDFSEKVYAESARS